MLSLRWLFSVTARGFAMLGAEAAAEPTFGSTAAAVQITQTAGLAAQLHHFLP
jgi:hypothetical protein